MAGILVHIKEIVSKLMLETLLTNKKSSDNRFSAALVTLFIRAVCKIMNSPDFISHISNAVINNPGFIALVAALVKWQEQRLVSKQANIEDKYQ